MSGGTRHRTSRDAGRADVCKIARAAATLGVTQFIVAGGETSDAVVQALGIKATK